MYIFSSFKQYLAAELHEGVVWGQIIHPALKCAPDSCHKQAAWFVPRKRGTHVTMLFMQYCPPPNRSPSKINPFWL